MKKIALMLFLVPALVSAQSGTPPTAGLTPQSPFYFIDRLGEVLREFVAFSPETKIRLQVSFAAERIAELRLDMEAKDVDAKGLAVAQDRLEAHLAKATKVVSEEKKKGKDVSEWEEVLKGEFEVSKRVLESSFELAKDALEDEREEVKDELETAKKSGDTARAEALREVLDDLEEEKDALENDREEQKKALESERERLDDEEDESSDDDDDSEDSEDDNDDRSDED